MIRPVAADGRIETGGTFTPILRPRVVERILAAAQQRITLIVAPAGYGKSVALGQFLAGHKAAPAIRFDVRPEHGTLLGFVRGLSDAMLAVAPDARKTLSGSYEKSHASKTPGDDLAQWMFAHIKPFTGTIAVDDLHLGEGDPEISKFLVSLIERTKGRVRWILASRSSLDLPVGSWLAYGEMDLNIDEQDLRFTLEEARETAKASRVAVRDEELAQILTMTAGWPTALSFALRTSTRSVDLRNISATTREMVYRYLAEQVYRSLTAEERSLLALIAFLPEIDIAVLKQAGYGKAKAAIESLRDRVAFIYSDRPGVYRCHDLFRDFLQHQVALEGDEAAEAMQMRAARALEKAGNLAGALSVFASLKSDTDILRMLAEHGFALVEQAHGDAVNTAIAALPHAARAQNAVVLALRGLRESYAGRFDRAQSLLERAMARSDDNEMRADFAVRLATLLFNQGLDVIELLAPYENDSRLPVLVQAKVIGLIVPAYAAAGRREDAMRAMTRAEHFAGVVESDEVRARLLHRMALAGLNLALPHDRIAALFTQAQTIASECGLYVTAAAALGGLESVVLLYEDDLTKAAWIAQQEINAAQKAGDRFSIQTALLQLINIEIRRGTPERLAALEKQFAAAITTDLGRAFYIVPARAMLAAWNDNFDEAYRLLSGASDRSFYAFDCIFNTAVQALYAIGAGKRDRAIELAGMAAAEIGEARFEYLHGERTAEISRIMCAIVEALAGRITIAQRMLSRKRHAGGAAVEAMQHCAIALLRMLKSPALADDFTDAIAELQSVGYGGIGRLLERAAAVVTREHVEPDNPLTKAELGVLEALAQGRSPKEIAQESGRSVFTIQAHIQNAIRKLGCSGRSEALVVARRKQLVKFS